VVDRESIMDKHLRKSIKSMADAIKEAPIPDFLPDGTCEMCGVHVVDRYHQKHAQHHQTETAMHLFHTRSLH
jgi:hypothetical protein